MSRLSDLTRPFFAVLLMSIVFIVPQRITSAHKDRIERPVSYTFTFDDGKTITLGPDNVVLQAYCNDISSGKRKLHSAELAFKTGEIVTFEGSGEKWTKIHISDSKYQLYVPEGTSKKIPIIHFMTVALLWDGLDERAFTASYFYIRCQIGNQRSFGEYPDLHLFFSGNKFSRSEVWRPTSRKSRQRSEL